MAGYADTSPVKVTSKQRVLGKPIEIVAGKLSLNNFYRQAVLDK